MSIIHWTLAWAGLLLGSCLVAGLYGATHDQLSYTISPEYFTLFKFRQFEIPAPYWNRIGAAIVGYRATWSQGVLIGVPVLSIAALCVRPFSRFVKVGAVSVLVVIATAMVVGAGAIALGLATIDAGHLPPYWIPAGCKDPVGFARVGLLHDGGYAGGNWGLFVAIGFVAWSAWRNPKATADPPHAANAETRTTVARAKLQFTLRSLLLTFVVVAAALAPPVATREPRINRSNYNRLSIGMTEAEVMRLLGQPPVELSPLDLQDVVYDESRVNVLANYPPPHTPKTWLGRRYAITVMLDEKRRVASKYYQRSPSATILDPIADALGL